MTNPDRMNEFTTSDGLRLRYVIDDYTDPWRQASAVVMIHAAMGSSRRFYAWVPHVACDFRVVRLDVRGHGESEVPGPSQLSFEHPNPRVAGPGVRGETCLVGPLRASATDLR